MHKMLTQLNVFLLNAGWFFVQCIAFTDELIAYWIFMGKGGLPIHNTQGFCENNKHR